MLFCGRYVNSSRIRKKQSASLLVATWHTPLVVLWTDAPPRSSKDTSYCVTDFTTSGPVTNIYEVFLTMKIKSVSAGL